MILFLVQSFSGSEWMNDWYSRRDEALESHKYWTSELKLEAKVFEIDVVTTKGGLAEAMNASGYNHMNLTETEGFRSVRKLK